jgi:CheY-like chemotaxis protein
MIRNFAVRVLRRIGYVTQVTRNGAEAIELYKKAKGSGEPFDAVILDLTNQFGMGGKEAIKKLIEIDPEVKGIVSTGYSNDPIVNDFRKFGFRGVLTKPYSVKKLDKTLHEILQKNNN